MPRKTLWDDVPTEDDLLAQVKTLNEKIWGERAGRAEVEDWLANFSADSDRRRSERFHALYLLSQFMFFGDKEMRELLRALFRDLYKYPIVSDLRKREGNTTDLGRLAQLFSDELRRTRFLGVGNPSESGTHLLYYFRQENRLGKRQFINQYEAFRPRSGARALRLRDPEVTRYVFIDDFCGSGEQGLRYSKEIVSDLRRAAKTIGTPVDISYFVLFATEKGINRVRRFGDFDNARAVVELDATHRCFSMKARHFDRRPDEMRKFAKKFCKEYGAALLPNHPLGFRDAQLLIAFHHNTPDNTLPVIWSEGSDAPWQPIFRRYDKNYGWGAT